MPDRDSTGKICDNLEFQRAVQRYLLGLPAVNQLANRSAILKMGPANATVPIWEDLVDSRTIELTANNNVRSPTFSTWAAWRSFLVDGDPRPGVDMVKRHTRIYPLAQAGNPPPLNFVNMSGKPFNMVAPADESFWPMLHRVVQ